MAQISPKLISRYEHAYYLELRGRSWRHVSALIGVTSIAEVVLIALH